MDKKPTEHVKITKRLIDSLGQIEKGQAFLRDMELPGFGLRNHPIAAQLSVQTCQPFYR